MADMLVIDGADDAIIGYTTTNDGTLAVYSYDQLVEVFKNQFLEHADDIDDAHDQAVEWISYNVEGAYMGPGQPLIVYPGDRDILDELADAESDDA